MEENDGRRLTEREISERFVHIEPILPHEAPSIHNVAIHGRFNGELAARLHKQPVDELGGRHEALLNSRNRENQQRGGDGCEHECCDRNPSFHSAYSTAPEAIK